MVVFKRAIAQSMFTAAALLATPHAFADDAPVERPAVDRPALPQSAHQSPASAEPAPAHAEPRHGSRPRQAGSAGAGARTRTRTRTYAQARSGDGHHAFLYLAAGPGLLAGLGGGTDFERTNPALTGAIGVEVPLRAATGLAFELDGDLELAGQADRGEYTGVWLRARLGQMLSPRTRLWGALGIGRAGYQTGRLAGSIAVGTSLMFVPKFGLDLSANLDLLGAANDNRLNAAGGTNDYAGGAVLLIAIRALFELHR